MPPIKFGTVTVNRPLADAVVIVRLSIEGRVRLWLTKRLLTLAVWVSGGDIRFKGVDD